MTVIIYIHISDKISIILLLHIYYVRETPFWSWFNRFVLPLYSFYSCTLKFELKVYTTNNIANPLVPFYIMQIVTNACRGRRKSLTARFEKVILYCDNAEID